MIETVHLRLIPYAPQHVLALIESEERFEQGFGIAPAEGLREFYASDEISPDWLAQLRASSSADPWLHGFAVVHRESHSVIGSVGFKGAPDETGMAEIAYGIVPAFQGQGYATEAAAALVAFAFGDGRVRVVRAHTLPEFNASTRVLEKLHFACVGEAVEPDDGLVWRWEHRP
jgi:RimJ/RimL family protein N-acetyltransferase